MIGDIEAFFCQGRVLNENHSDTSSIFMRQLTLIHALTLYQYYVSHDCRVSKKTWADFVVPADQLRGGLCNDVKPALYYPGFPTF